MHIFDIRVRSQIEVQIDNGIRGTKIFMVQAKGPLGIMRTKFRQNPWCFAEMALLQIRFLAFLDMIVRIFLVSAYTRSC